MPKVRDSHGRFAADNPGRVLGSCNRMSKRSARRASGEFEASFDDVAPRMKRWFLPQSVSLLARPLPDEAGRVA